MHSRIDVNLKTVLTDVTFVLPRLNVEHNSFQNGTQGDVLIYSPGSSGGDSRS